MPLLIDVVNSDFTHWQILNEAQLDKLTATRPYNICIYVCQTDYKTVYYSIELSFRPVGRKVRLSLNFPVFSPMRLELLARHTCSEYDIPVNEEWLGKIRFDSAHLNSQKVRKLMRLYDCDTHLVMNIMVISGVCGY